MAPRHYASAIAKQKNAHALFATPFSKLKSRTLGLLDTITGGTVDADTAAEAYRIEEQRRNATCRGCDITFDGQESLSAHHSLFPDHATRRRTPARSQSAPMLAAMHDAEPAQDAPPPPVPRRNRSTVTEPGVLIDFHSDDTSPEQSGLLSPPRPETAFHADTLKPRGSVASIGRVHRKPVPSDFDDEERRVSSSESAGRSRHSPALSFEPEQSRHRSHSKGQSSNSYPAWRPFDANASSDSSTGASPNPGTSPSRRASPSPGASPHFDASPFDEQRPERTTQSRQAPPPPPVSPKGYSRPAPPLPPSLKPRRKSTNPFLPDDAAQPPASPGHPPRSPSNPFSAF